MYCTSAGTVRLTSLACGNQHIWACDSKGGVYFRVGTQPLNPSLMLPAWIMIEPPVQVSKASWTELAFIKREAVRMPPRTHGEVCPVSAVVT